MASSDINPVKGMLVDVVKIHHSATSLSVVTRENCRVVFCNNNHFSTTNQRFSNAHFNDIVMDSDKGYYILVVKAGEYTAERISRFTKDVLKWSGDTQTVDFCKKALAQGASIQRKSGSYCASNSGATDMHSESFVSSKRPTWKAQDGYRVDPSCHWWVTRQTQRFYESRL